MKTVILGKKKFDPSPFTLALGSDGKQGGQSVMAKKRTTFLESYKYDHLVSLFFFKIRFLHNVEKNIKTKLVHEK